MDCPENKLRPTHSTVILSPPAAGEGSAVVIFILSSGTPFLLRLRYQYSILNARDWGEHRDRHAYDTGSSGFCDGLEPSTEIPDSAIISCSVRVLSCCDWRKKLRITAATATPAR